MIGIIAAAYALYVEFKLEEMRPPVAVPVAEKSTPFSAMSKPKSEYKAMCDFKVGGFSGSCTKVFESSYGHILSHWGILPKGHPLDLSLASTGGTVVAFINVLVPESLI